MSKSGTLTYQMMFELRDFGFSTAVGIGGDPIIGTTHIDCLEAFENDPDTAAIVMIGEIGGDAEERAAAYIKDNVTKPVVGYVAGFTAPEGKTMGHAGAIVSGSSGTAQAKKEALEAAGCQGRQDAERDRPADAGDHAVAVSDQHQGPDRLAGLTWPRETARLLLRRATPSDAAAMWAYRSLPEVSEWITSAPADLEAFTALQTPQRLRDTLVVSLRTCRARSSAT